MTPEERLEQLIFDEDIFFGLLKLTSAKGIYSIKGTKKVIILSSELKTVEEKVDTLAHELGHHFAGLSYKQDYISYLKDEHRADRWVVEHIVTLERLVNYESKGCETFDEQRECFGFSADYFKRLMDIKSHIYYPCGIYKNNIITFQPFNIFKAI